MANDDKVFTSNHIIVLVTIDSKYLVYSMCIIYSFYVEISRSKSSGSAAEDQPVRTRTREEIGGESV